MYGLRIASFEMVGTAPLLFGKQVFEPRGNEETNDQHEERTWRLKVTTDSDGYAAINSDAVTRSLEWSASWLNLKVPGGAGGKATFKKRFLAGVRATAPSFPVFNGKSKQIKPSDMEMQWIPCPSRGDRGGPKRVLKAFPTLYAWRCPVSLLILDQAITEDVFRRHIETSGIFDGMGSMRRGNGGPNGTFKVQQLAFCDYKG